MGSDRQPPPISVPHGFEDDACSRLLRARPPADAVAWVEATLGGAVTGVRALRGGRTSAMHALRVTGRAGTGEPVILRRYVLPHIVEEEPDIVRREANALGRLARTPLAVPQLLAVDRTGAAAGTPAVLMSRVPGRLEWTPTDVDPWLRGLAVLLVGLHAVPLPAARFLGEFTPYPPQRWQAPEWMRRPRLWDRAVDVFLAPPLDKERAFVHRDYHPGNVLWQRGRLAGVVDWQAASVGPASVDPAWCRLNLLGRFGLEVADRLVALWSDVSGRAYHPWAEVVLLVDRLSWPSPPRARERDELELTLARRLSELGC